MAKGGGRRQRRQEEEWSSGRIVNVEVGQGQVCVFPGHVLRSSSSALSFFPVLRDPTGENARIQKPEGR